MALPESGIVSQGQGCPRGRYSIDEATLEDLARRLDELDGQNPHVTYNIDVVRQTLAGGGKASASCIAYYLNNKILQNENLAKFNIFVHTSMGNIKFDHNPPSRAEAEEPSS